MAWQLAMRKELKDLEEAIVRQDSPTDPRTRTLAEAKIAALRGQIGVIKRGKGRQPAPSE